MIPCRDHYPLDPANTAEYPRADLSIGRSCGLAARGLSRLRSGAVPARRAEQRGMMTAIWQLHDLGQRFWPDHTTREIHSGGAPRQWTIVMQ